MIVSILEAIERATGLLLVPLESGSPGEQVIYNTVPIADNGVHRQYRVELNIVADSLAAAERYDEAVRRALLSVGDGNPIADNMTIELAGGGTLTSKAGVHRLTSYVVTEGI